MVYRATYRYLGYILVISITFTVILSLVGVRQAGALQNPNSQSVGLQAEIPTNPPKVPATIVIPASGQTISSLPIKVSGLCTGDVLVKVYSNGVFIGSTQCLNGSYSLSVDLFNGANDLVVRIYDALDQAGPDSATTRVTYTQSGFNANGPRVTLTSNFARRGANPNESLIWPIIISGGTAPFAISIDWGDEKTDLVSRSLAGEFNIDHIYTASGMYAIVIKGTDSNSNSAFLQLMGIANGAISKVDQNAASNSTTTKQVFLWWPMLIAGVLIIFSFWLGRKDQLESLRRQAENRVRY